MSISSKKVGYKVDIEKIKIAVRMILEAIGEDPEREGLKETPLRVAACTPSYSREWSRTRLIS